MKQQNKSPSGKSAIKTKAKPSEPAFKTTDKRKLLEKSFAIAPKKWMSPSAQMAAAKARIGGFAHLKKVYQNNPRKWNAFLALSSTTGPSKGPKLIQKQISELYIFLNAV